MKDLKERKRDAVVSWAENQSSNYLASMLKYMLTNSQISALVRDNNIKIPK